MSPVNRMRRASSFSLRTLAYWAQLVRRARLAGLARFSRAIEGIKINAITLEERDSGLMWIKRRQTGSGLIALFANLFFFLARARIHLWIDLKKWQSWEVACFRLLYGNTIEVFPEGKRIVCVGMVPGKSVREWVIESTFAIPAIRAAGKELRRAHSLWSSDLGDYWSHGDPHMENLLYDLESDQARLIDFELIHIKSVPAVERHADDLLVFLQELMGCVSAEQWVPFALALIEAYNDPFVLAEVRKRLIVPRGCSAVWWKLRTDYMNRGLMIKRIDTLNTALGEYRLAAGTVVA
jgi:hypothetical protein